jgi:hypothetical protein
VRSPAFIAGALVPTAVRGRWYDGIFAVADWSATLLALAGVANVSKAMGTKPGFEATPVHPLDGRPMWAVLMTETALPIAQASAGRLGAGLGRDEWYITAGTLRVVDYKLIIQNPGGRGLTGTGGGWVRPATNATSPYPDQGEPFEKTRDPIDEFLAHGCSKADSCLFRVGGPNSATPWQNDARGHTNLAHTMPQLVATMMARMEALE